ncbi:hypothetical protein KY308_01720 [Candidatus Woesearchaeota archaeon]|nr:hypothetical protein [Candidatus Woesearchaeota archaeon]
MAYSLYEVPRNKKKSLKDKITNFLKPKDEILCSLYLWSGVGVGVVSMLSIMGAAMISDQYLQTNNMSPGYIKPRDVKIQLEDLNCNGLRETIMEIEGNGKYTLKYDKDGNPTIQKLTAEYER